MKQQFITLLVKLSKGFIRAGRVLRQQRATSPSRSQMWALTGHTYVCEPLIGHQVHLVSLKVAKLCGLGQWVSARQANSHTSRARDTAACQLTSVIAGALSSLLRGAEPLTTTRPAAFAADAPAVDSARVAGANITNDVTFGG